MLARLLLAVLLLGGCATHLRPAPGAQLVPGREQAAVAEAGGVRVSARAGAWRGRPAALGDVATPILVSVENTGTVPVRLRYEHFSLRAADGRVLPGRGPYEVEGVAAEAVPGYAFARPPLFWYDPLWRHPFWWDPFWYDPFWFDHPRFSRVPLPTGDMVQMALPERVVEPGARVTGFVYFDRVTRAMSPLTFTARLVSDRTGEDIGAVAIPFVVE